MVFELYLNKAVSQKRKLYKRNKRKEEEKVEKGSGRRRRERREFRRRRRRKGERVRSLTSELLGKMGWFMAQLPLCKVLGWVEGPGSQDTRQNRHDCGDWKAREAEVVTSATAWGPKKKARGSLRSIWLPGPLTPSDRTSQAGRRRQPECRRSPRPGSSQSASR